ncbi:hypothetical protein AC578_5634 [Pseudocercospora eumusae]|uniref:Uncharacterized protein n=1 Tax=Pseudocercospora eumusae TaxID=321146 RepID=A0A139HT98_9PEZI|nr:hypothetical protein AC578_5634 [Pseudocercospora eumusae]
MNAQVVVVCVIVGAGAAVLIGYATTRYFFSNTSNSDGPTDEFNQAAYMREVRLRNVEQIGAMNGYGHRHMASFLTLKEGIADPFLQARARADAYSDHTSMA